MRRKQAYSYLLVVAIVAALLVFDFRVLTSSDVVAPRLKAFLEERLGGSVEIGEVDLSEVGVIRCSHLSIRPPPEIAPRTDYIGMDRLHIEYRGVPLGGGLEPTRILVNGLKANASRKAILYWTRRLLPDDAGASGAPATLPVVRIEADEIWTDLPEVFAPGYRLYLQDVRLSIHPLDQRKVWGEFSADAGSYGKKWAARGLYDIAGRSARVDFDIPAVDVREPLARRLVDTIHHAWENYGIEGVGRVEGRLDFDFAAAAPAVLRDWAFRVLFDRAQHATGRYRNFPYLVRDLEGEIELLPDGVRLRGLQGRTGPVGDGRMFLHGRSTGYAAEAAVDIDLRLDRFSLDDDVRAAAPATLHPLWTDYRVSGPVDVEGHISREEGPERPTRIRLNLRAVDVTARPREFPYEVRHLRGEVQFNDGEVVLRHLEGVHEGADGGALMHIEGRVESIEKRDTGFVLEVRADALPVDAELRDAVPPDVRKVWELLSPGGRVDVVWTQERAAGPGVETRHRVQVRGHGARLTYRDLPVPLSDVWGVAEYDGRSLTLQHVTGRYRDATLTVDGGVSWTDGGTDVRLEVGGEQVPIDGTILGILPDRVRDSAVEAKLAGRLDGRVRVTHRSGPARGVELRYLADLSLQDGSLQSYLPLSEVRGRVTLEGESRPAPGGRATAIVGTLKLANVRIAGTRASDVGAVFRIADDRVTFHDLRGTAYDGIVHAPFLEVDAGRGRYEGTARVEGLDLSLLVRDVLVAERPITGRMSGQISFGGEGGKIETLRGRGTLDVNDGNLWEVPVFLQLVRVLNLGPLPAQESFRSGSVRFAIAGEAVRVEVFRFDSDSVHVTGGGRIGFNGRLDLTIDTEFSSTLLSEIPGLRQLIDVLKRNVVAVHATGTFKNPHLRLKAFPLRDLKAVGGGREEDREDPSPVKGRP